MRCILSAKVKPDEVPSVPDEPLLDRQVEDTNTNPKSFFLEFRREASPATRAQ
jgi:hypothetical protein